MSEIKYFHTHLPHVKHVQKAKINYWIGFCLCFRKDRIVGTVSQTSLLICCPVITEIKEKWSLWSKLNEIKGRFIGIAGKITESVAEMMEGAMMDMQGEDRERIRPYRRLWLFIWQAFRIIESQNVVGWEWSQSLPSPNPCCKQGCPPPVQAARGPIQPGFEHLQGEDTQFLWANKR